MGLAVLGVVYLLPSLLGTLLQLTHTAEHLAKTLADPYPPGAVVHSHGGSTHAHGFAVTALAAAVEADGDDAEDEDPEAVPPLIFLAFRSTPPVAEAAPPDDRMAPARFSAPSPRRDLGTPPVPPPRA